MVLTDICMPYVDGLEVARYVEENMPSTKVVIITGYDEFDYAKKGTGVSCVLLHIKADYSR